MSMSWLVLVMSWISYRYGDKSNISNNSANESLFSQDLEKGRSSYEHAALRCDRTNDGERCGEGTEADQRGCFEFYFTRSPQLTTA